MLELSITNYQMRRPPMATNVRALNDMTARLVIHATANDYVQKMITTAMALQKQNQVFIEKDPGGTMYNLSRNFKDSVGTLYLRENRKLHYEIDTAYTEEIEIKAFFSKKIEKRHHVACVTGVVPFTFDHLMEVRIAGNRITFTYSLTPDGKGQTVQFGFEMADVRQFARDLYEWAERKNFKIVKAIDEDFLKEPVDTQPSVAPPPEGTLYSIIIEPDNTALEYGQSLQFSYRPIDVKGNDVPVNSVKWAVDPPSIGTITQNGLFTPNTDNGKGTIIIQVTSGAVSTSGFATVSLITKAGHAPPPPPAVDHAPQYAPPPPQQAYSPPPQPATQPAQQVASPPPPPPSPAPPGKICLTCNGPLSLSAQYNRWYCPKCQKWE